MKGLFHALKGKRSVRGASVNETAPLTQEQIEQQQQLEQRSLPRAECQPQQLLSPSNSGETALPARQLSAVTGAVENYMQAPTVIIPDLYSKGNLEARNSDDRQHPGQQLTESNVARTASATYHQANSSVPVGAHQQASSYASSAMYKRPNGTANGGNVFSRTSGGNAEAFPGASPGASRQWDERSVQSMTPSQSSAATTSASQSTRGRMKMMLPSATPGRTLRPSGLAADRRLSGGGGFGSSGGSGRVTNRQSVSQKTPPSHRPSPAGGAASRRTPDSTARTPTPKRLDGPSNRSSGGSGGGFGGISPDKDTPKAADCETDTVKVFVRARPVSQQELQLGGGADRPCLDLTGPKTLRLATQPHLYTFDHVAGESLSQEEFYNLAGRPIVDNCLQGFNSCIFAYGQTGSGKTYTMLGTGFEPGTNPASEQAQLRGLIPRVFDDVFTRLNAMQHVEEEGVHKEVVIRCSFLEIYNEIITDLLNPEATQLLIREDTKKGVYVDNLSQHIVHTMSDVAALLERGQSVRKSGETLMNSESSRSHSVFTAEVTMRSRDDSGITTVRSSRLNLVDLAGSERQRQSGATGQRLREASGINVSLTVLGKVIMSLVDFQRGKVQHVPYRNSRLTFLLRDSLGGNAKTIMIANVSPAVANMSDTLSTLRFAQRVKAIQNTVFRNEDTQGDPAQLHQEIRRLKEELHFLRQNCGGSSGWQGGAHGASPAPSPKAAIQSPNGTDSQLASYWQDHNVSTEKALAGSLRREGEQQKEALRMGREMGALQELLKARDKDLQRVKAVVKLKESLISRFEKSNDGADSFNFDGNGEKEAVIVELKEEARILRTRMQNNPEVKRYQAENMALSAELTRYQSYVDRREREALLDDVATLRTEVLRLSDSVRRLSADPKVKEAEVAALQKAHDESLALEDALIAAESISEAPLGDQGLRGDSKEEASPPPQPEARSQAAEVAALQSQLVEKAQAAKQSQAEAAEAIRSRDRDAAEKAELLRQLEALRSKPAEVTQEAAESAHQLAAEVEHLRSEAEANRQLAAEMEHVRAEAALSRQLAAEAEQLRAEAVSGRQLVAELEGLRSQAASSRQLETEAEQLRNELIASRQLAAEAEQLRAEAVSGRQLIAELEGFRSQAASSRQLAAEAEQLRVELAASHQLAAEAELLQGQATYDRQLAVEVLRLQSDNSALQMRLDAAERSEPSSPTFTFGRVSSNSNLGSRSPPSSPSVLELKLRAELASARAELALKKQGSPPRPDLQPLASSPSVGDQASMQRQLLEARQHAAVLQSRLDEVEQAEATLEQAQAAQGEAKATQEQAEATLEQLQATLKQAPSLDDSTNEAATLKQQVAILERQLSNHKESIDEAEARAAAAEAQAESQELRAESQQQRAERMERALHDTTAAAVRSREDSDRRRASQAAALQAAIVDRGFRKSPSSERLPSVVEDPLKGSQQRLRRVSLLPPTPPATPPLPPLPPPASSAAAMRRFTDAVLRAAETMPREPTEQQTDQPGIDRSLSQQEGEPQDTAQQLDSWHDDISCAVSSASSANADIDSSSDNGSDALSDRSSPGLPSDDASDMASSEVSLYHHLGNGTPTENGNGMLDKFGNGIQTHVLKTNSPFSATAPTEEPLGDISASLVNGNKQSRAGSTPEAPAFTPHLDDVPSVPFSPEPSRDRGVISPTARLTIKRLNSFAATNGSPPSQGSLQGASPSVRSPAPTKAVSFVGSDGQTSQSQAGAPAALAWLMGSPRARVSPPIS